MASSSEMASEMASASHTDPRPDNRVTALLLPGYSPNLAWLARALNANRVILDDLHPFSRKSRVHRTKIRTPDGHQWLTIPFVGEDRRKPINRVRIDEHRPWLRHHLQALEYNYRNSPYFDFYEPEIRADLETAYGFVFLVDAVRHLMQRQWLYLELPFTPEWASELDSPESDPVYIHRPSRRENRTGSERQKPGEHLPEKRAPEDRVTVWQEPDSRHYQRPHPDANQSDAKHSPSGQPVSGQTIVSQSDTVQPNAIRPVFHIPQYRQHFPGFVPGCGMLDLLFEYGPDAWQILDRLTGPRSADRSSVTGGS
ncbi:MAG: WbqC family protein [Cyclonatronaceae bacterium]